MDKADDLGQRVIVAQLEIVAPRDVVRLADRRNDLVGRQTEIDAPANPPDRLYGADPVAYATLTDYERVAQDETEQGVRALLNLGHTFGHAIEKVTGVPHGQAVSAGMVLAAGLSQQRGLITAREKDRLCALLEQLNLPTGMTFDQDAVLEALGKDKKREGDRVHFVLLDGLGQSVVRDIPLAELRDHLSQTPP